MSTMPNLNTNTNNIMIATEVCEKEGKKTINGEHVIGALKVFHIYYTLLN